MGGFRTHYYSGCCQVLRLLMPFAILPYSWLASASNITNDQLYADAKVTFLVFICCTIHSYKLQMLNFLDPKIVFPTHNFQYLLTKFHFLWNIEIYIKILAIASRKCTQWWYGMVNLVPILQCIMQ